MMHAITNITTISTSLKEECDVDKNTFFYSQFLYTNSISAFLSHLSCLSALSDKQCQQRFWNRLPHHRSMPQAADCLAGQTCLLGFCH